MSHFRIVIKLVSNSVIGSNKKRNDRVGEAERSERSDRTEQPTVYKFPGEREGHRGITEQKEKTEMTFLKGLLCGICRRKNEM